MILAGMSTIYPIVYIEAWKIQVVDRVETRELSNWALKPLTLRAGCLRVLILTSPRGMNVRIMQRNGWRT